MSDSGPVRPYDGSMADAELAGLFARCAEGAEGLAPPDGEGVGRLRAAQKIDLGCLALAVCGERPVGVCAVALPEGPDRAELRFLGVCPEQRRRGIGRALEAHAVALARRQGRGAIRTGSPLDSRNTAGVAFLERAGWHPVRGASLRMWRSLEDLPPVELAGGYAIRSYAPGDEAAFVRIKNAAFAGEHGGGRDWTAADFQKEYLDSPHFRPGRVFFAVCNGEPVGTTTAWTAMHEGREVGLIHWVAVAPEHRQKGLGWALNVQALHRLREMGYREAILNTNETLASAVRLYRRLGFRELHRRAAYEKGITEKHG